MRGKKEEEKERDKEKEKIKLFIRFPWNRSEIKTVKAKKESRIKIKSRYK